MVKWFIVWKLEIFNEELFPDLLFFNRELNCMVVVELKKGGFKPGYIGQLQTYMRVLDDKVRKPHENPTIGILLCKSANKAFVEYVIRDYNSPHGCRYLQNCGRHGYKTPQLAS